MICARDAIVKHLLVLPRAHASVGREVPKEIDEFWAGDGPEPNRAPSLKLELQDRVEDT